MLRVRNSRFHRDLLWANQTFNEQILVLKLSLTTAQSTYGPRAGTTPKLLVKSCDGRVKFSDNNVEQKGSGQSKSWEINDFDLEKDTVELEAGSTDGWMVNLALEICDDSGNNCQAKDVYENYPATSGEEAGNAFWIDYDCSGPRGHQQNGCDATHHCNCYKEKFYLRLIDNRWSLDDDNSTCDVRGVDPKMTVSCNNNADDTVLMTAAVRKTEVHDKPSDDFADNGDYWQATYTADQLEKSFENNLIFEGVAAADYLVLSKTVDLPCKNLRVDGVDVCQSVGAGLTWTCRYSLADQTKTDAYTVTGQDTQATADGIGTLNYVLEVLADKSIGEQVQFEIRPVNEGLVTADIKHCEVAESADAGAAKVSIIGDDTDATKDKCYVSSINSGLTEHTGTGTLSGYWNAFKWSTSDNTDAENQQLSCSIALSQNGNNQPAGANC